MLVPAWQDEGAMTVAPTSITPTSAGARHHRIITSIDVIKKALLTCLPGLWKLALDEPPLVTTLQQACSLLSHRLPLPFPSTRIDMHMLQQHKLQGLLSVALCDIPS